MPERIFVVAVHDRATRCEVARFVYGTIGAALLGRVELLIQWVRVEHRSVVVTGIMRG